MNCDDCGNDVHQRLALNTEIDGEEEDGSTWFVEKEIFLCTSCYKKRLDSVPTPGVFTKRLMGQLGIDEKRFINEGNVTWNKKELLKMVEKQPDEKYKLKPEFKHLSGQ